MLNLIKQKGRLPCHLSNSDMLFDATRHEEIWSRRMPPSTSQHTIMSKKVAFLIGCQRLVHLIGYNRLFLLIAIPIKISN